MATGTCERSTRGRSVDDVGFRHCWAPEQPPAIAAYVYRDCPAELVVLELSRSARDAEPLRAGR